MKPAPFDYVRPATIDEALALAASLEGAKILAGGQSLMPMLNMRFVQPDYVIDINRLNLDYIRFEDGRLHIGAATRQRDIELSPLVMKHVPLFGEALRQVGHVQTRNRGTIGGSLCHLDPSAELPCVCMTIDAEIVVRSAQRGARVIPMRDFPAAYMTPAIEPDEIVTEIQVPVWPPRHGYALEEFARRHGDFALASATGLISLSGDVVERAAITIGGLAEVPRRVTEAEQMLTGQSYRQLDVEAAASLCGNIEAISDTQASTQYRQQLAKVMASRALTRAIDRAAGAPSS
jgi:aerobic carbon-monoxide dehydrogenase medium subunit